MSNVPSRIPVLRRRPLTTSQKLNITANTTANEVNIRFRKSTTTQQPQTSHKGKITTIEYLSRELEEPVRALSKALREFQSVLGEESEPEDLSERWQTINLVLHAFAPFVWMHISDIHKEELKDNGMNTYLHCVKSGGPCPASDVAWRVYDAIDLDLTYIAERMITAKRDASRSRNPLARPDISDAGVREFLKVDFGDGTPDGHTPLEMAAFDFIKETANTEANIQEANRDYN